MARGLRIGAVACLALLAVWLLWQQSDENVSPGITPGAKQQSPETNQTEPIRPAFSSLPATRACEPYDPHAHLSEDELAEAWEHESAMLLDVLRVSDDAEHVATAAFILSIERPVEATDLFERAAALAPDDSLIAWLQLQHCGRLEDYCGDRLDRVGRDAVRVDGGNAAVWASIARFRQLSGDTSRAAEAMRMAAAASDYNAWYGELVLLFDRGLVAASNEPSLHRLVRAFGMAAGVYSAEIYALQSCNENAVHSPAWRDYCMRLGENMTNHAKDYMHRSVGFSLMKAMYEIDGDTRQSESAERQRKALQTRVETARMHQSQGDVFRDETLLRAYLDVFVAANEFAALEFAEKEIKRLASVPGYDPCKLPNPGS